MRLLLVEDDPELAAILTSGFREHGIDVVHASTFAFRELLARVRALGRRVPSLIPRKVAIADLEVDLSARRAVRAGKPIELKRRERPGL